MLKIPNGFREIQLLLPNATAVGVVALAKPDNYRQNPQTVFQYLKNNGVQVIFGLEASASLACIAAALELEYFDVTVEDFRAPPLELFDRVYEEVLKQAKNDKKIAIHCFGGFGRTGTVLAALKLREQSMSALFYDPAYQHRRVMCDPSCDCSLNVARVVEALRSEPDNRYIIESEVQIQRLCEYERLLITRRTTLESEETKESEQKSGLS